jgi:hypothetical protein
MRNNGNGIGARLGNRLRFNKSMNKTTQQGPPTLNQRMKLNPYKKNNNSINRIGNNIGFKNKTKCKIKKINLYLNKYSCVYNFIFSSKD